MFKVMLILKVISFVLVQVGTVVDFQVFVDIETLKVKIRWLLKSRICAIQHSDPLSIIPFS